MTIDWHRWENRTELTPRAYVCGYCGNNTASYVGYNNANPGAFIYICGCGMPTFFCGGEQYPGPILGRNIEALPEDVGQIYKEIRDSIKGVSYTGALLLGRKLIMHLAVDACEAKEGDTFKKYVDKLKEGGYVPPTGGPLLEYIKELGNQKNHEIKIGTKEEAEKMLKFVEGLLIFIYEFPTHHNSVESDASP